MKKISKQKGYTIIETMIAVSLFIIIVMTGMGSLLSANLLHQKSQNMRSIIDNLSFVMEDMSSALRTGSNYHCIADENGGFDGSMAVAESSNGNNCPGIAFEYQDGKTDDPTDQWVYSFIGIDDRGQIWRKSIPGSYDPYINTNYVQMTPDEVVINSLNFSIVGAEKGGPQQPFVTITLRGTITLTYKNIVTPFYLQTSVSQRGIDI